jgi:tetratricopeptide (TPR) repeat protein
MKGKVEFTQGAQGQAIEDLEWAINLDSNGTFFTSHVSPLPPKSTSPPCEWNTTDLDALVKDNPKDYRVYLFRALYYEFNAFWSSSDHSDGKYYGMALADIRTAIELNPKVALAYYMLGNNIQSTVPEKERYSSSTEATENDRKILQSYRTAISLDSKLIPAYVARANVLWYLHIRDRAINDYSKAIDLDPNDSDLYNRRAQLYMEMQSYDHAAEDFTAAIKKSKHPSGQFPLYEQRGEAYAALGNYAEAISDYSHAIRGILELQVPHSLGLKTFRTLYPEYNGISDETLSRKLHEVLQPSWEYKDFTKRFSGDQSGLAATSEFGEEIPIGVRATTRRVCVNISDLSWDSKSIHRNTRTNSIDGGSF